MKVMRSSEVRHFCAPTGFRTVFLALLLAVGTLCSSSASDGCDFNGDGFDDLAVGIPNEDVVVSGVPVVDAGAVHVLYGSAAGLQASGIGGPDDQIWHQKSRSVKDNPEEGDRFGAQVCWGDFNGDGFDDLAVAAPREDIIVSGIPVVDAGAVHVLYGSAAGLQANGVGGPDDQFWHQNSGSVKDVVEAGQRFGADLACCDINADGFEDLIIGVPAEDIGTLSNAGAINVLYGSPSGLQAVGVGGPDDQFWYQDSSGVLDVAEQGDRFGAELCCADFNGDGFDDVAIGVPGEGVGAADNAGAVNVLYGSISGLTATGNQFWHQDSTGIADVAEADDRFGFSLACCDFNGDGRDDLAVGVPDEDIGTFPGAGAVHVLYGSAVGLTATGSQFWTQDSPDVEDVVESFDRFGHALACCDFNGDGFDDLAIGAREENVGVVAEAGAVNVLYGSAAGLQANGVGGPNDQFWHQDSPGVEDVAEINDRFGADVFCGDFNGDGRDDLAIGVPCEDVGTIIDAGAVNVLYGSGVGLQTTAPADQFWHQDSPGVVDLAEEEDAYGWGRCPEIE